MGTPIRLLIVEDSEEDARLIYHTLQRGGYDPKYERVETDQGLKAAIRGNTWDAVIIDYVLTNDFNALAALRILLENGITAPLIVISGKVGEEVVVEVMKAGAHDFIVKTSLKRLVPVLQRELGEAEVRRQHQIAKEAIRKEYSFRNKIIENIADGVCVCHQIKEYPFTKCTVWNDRMTEITGYTLEAINRQGWYPIIYPDNLEMQAKVLERIEKIRQGNDLRAEEWQFTRPDGEERTVSISTSMIESDDGITHILAIMQDITKSKTAEKALLEAYEVLEDRAQKRTESLSKTSEKSCFLSSRLISIQEEERELVAQELRNNIGHSLSAMRANLSSAIETIQKDENAEAYALLQSLFSEIQRAIDEIEAICTCLRPSILKSKGIISAIDWTIKSFEKLLPDCKVQLETDLKETDIPYELKLTIYRIVQEALSNIKRHSHAQQAKVTLEKLKDRIELAIQDNGKGFDLNAVSLDGNTCLGIGLIAMRERAHLSGGTLSVESQPGAGTTICASWPCQD